MIFISVKRLVQLFFYFIAAMALYVFYKTIGLSMMFTIALALLSLKFAPVLFLPILIVAVGLHFSGDFSFIADFLELVIVLVIGVPFCILAYGCYQEIKKDVKNWFANR